MRYKSIPILLLLCCVTACGQPAPAAAPALLEPATAPVVEHAVATTSALVARKATLQAMMAATQTALPTTTLTPSAPPNTRACQAADLRGTVDSNGATGSIEFVVQYTNAGSTLCVLQGPPRMRLLDQRGQPLAINYYVRCVLCYEYDADAMQTSTPEQLALTQTVADAVLNGPIGVEPGTSVRVVLLWSNWCQPASEEGISMRLLLTATNEMLDIPLTEYIGGRCNAPNAPSSMSVSHFQH